MQIIDDSLKPKELTLFLCTNERIHDSIPFCGQTLSFEQFKELKRSCLQKHGFAIKLVATRCQGVCPKKAFYGTLIQPERKINTEHYIFNSKEEVEELLEKNLLDK